jgi:hypothetical protein
MKTNAALCLLLLCASTALAAALPVSLANGTPVVQLDLNGKTLPFVLDTGASTSLHLTPEVAESLPGLACTGRQRKSIDEGLLLHLADGKKTYRLVLDTAASVSIIKSSAAEAASRVEQCAFKLGPGRPCRTITLSLPGGKSISSLLMALPDEFKADGILGTDFFQQMPVLFDLQHQMLYLRPPAPAA